MDMTQLAEATAGHLGEGRRLGVEDVQQTLDVLFGTVEHPGTVAEALRRGETVLLGSFGSFHSEGKSAVFRPGKALDEYLRGLVG
ncbi:hypothetical protein AB0E11_04955 [Streptomyces fradiae]|nr:MULTISPECIES: hypothetical protein [Streptomyces]UQS29703.1 hypothetical protein J5J01_22795 [Streptomyces fradiae]